MTLDGGANATAILVGMGRSNATPSRVLEVADVVAELEAAPARGRARKSRLYLWLQRNHDHLVREFDRNAPAWGRLAAILGSRGVLDGDGKPPTARGARGAWYRVRREVAAERERAASITAGITFHTLPSARTAPPPLPVAPPVSIQLDEDGPTRPRFKLASLRNATPADGPPQPDHSPAASEPEQASAQPQKFDDVMAEFLGRPSTPPKGDE